MGVHRHPVYTQGGQRTTASVSSRFWCQQQASYLIYGARQQKAEGYLEQILGC